jgi:carbon-monoxide dehydrogenase small subunit
MREVTRHVRVTVNGVASEHDVEPRLLLIDLLRDVLGLTGAHVGCDEGICGACTVEVNGETVKSCLMFAAQADGAEVTTIEGLAQNGELDPVQQAFRASHAVQCGFCTPGMVMSARAIVRAGTAHSREQIREQLVGNICRCTGYQQIVDAVERVALAPEEVA